MISGPACATTIFGARKRYPGAVLCAGVCTRTSGGLRSGREKKCCVGPGFGAGAAVVAAGAGDALFSPLSQPATRIAKRATKAASFTRESIVASGHADDRRTRERTVVIVECLRCYPRPGASKRDGRLESGLRYRQNGPERDLVRPGE